MKGGKFMEKRDEAILLWEELTEEEQTIVIEKLLNALALTDSVNKPFTEK